MLGINRLSCCHHTLRHLRSFPTKNVRSSSSSKAPAANATTSDSSAATAAEAPKEAGAMSQRLEAMAEQALEEGGPRARTLISDTAGFSEELKQRLETKILDAKFRNEHPEAFAAVNMPAGAGQGTRDTAAAPHWTGTEALHETALRMLDDAHKPLRGAAGRVPSARPAPKPAPGATVDIRPKGNKPASKGHRLRSAIDRTSLYALAQSDSMTERERAETRAQLRERFEPGARSMPATVAGLQSVASQRIEDAIARGQFRNIPRGRGVGTERDPTASSPFLDTTEYFMNKIIKKQEMLPPWVEKQGELTAAAARFRARLRAEWTRHAARLLASEGGGLEAQVRRAEAYARAEDRENPRTRPRETITAINSQGRLTTFSVEAEPGPTETGPTETPLSSSEPTASVAEQTQVEPRADPTAPPRSPSTAPAPFRDAAWEATERGYHTAAIAELNSLARSYNLMAPQLAQRPYFDLARELRACYADAAPALPAELRRRAERLRARGAVAGHRAGGLMEKFAAGGRVAVFESTRPHYGFREFWRDVFGGRENAGG